MNLKNPLNYLGLLFLWSLTSCSPPVLPILKEKQQLHASNTWQYLSSYPQRRGRTDDLCFVNPQLGWTVNSRGVLHKTEDGGENWTLQFKKEDSFFRAVVFKDSLQGWLGTLGRGDKYLHSTDSIVLYETQDGGENWKASEILGPYPGGLCGMQKVTDQVIVACGRVRGPSYFLKTVDGGKTWQSTNLDHKAGSLVAPYFFDEQHGILVGGTTRDKIECRALVLSTKDGGQSWDTLYISNQKGEYCWKVSFPSKEVGYISVQRNVRDGRFYFLKSTDGGKTWLEKDFAQERYLAQGIGFLNEKVGWIGGSFKYTYETRDGGESWLPVSDAGKGLNSFQFVDKHTAYTVGRGVYRLNTLTTLPDGKVYTYHKNGQRQNEKTYKKGLLHGRYKSYYPNGQTESKGQYKKNLKVGKWKFYKEQGSLKEKVVYQNDIARIKSKILEDYVGVYQVNETVYRFVTLEDGRLHSTRSDNQRKLAMYPESGNKFFYGFNMDVKILFVRDEQGKVSHTINYQPGQETKAQRLSDEAAAPLWSLFRPKE